MANLILNSLEIHNFRAFHDLKIDHLRRVNLIVGKNNFYGRNDIKPGHHPIQIGPINSPQEMLSIAVDWSVTETRDGSIHTTSN